MGKTQLEKIYDVLDKYYLQADVLDEGGHIYAALESLDRAISKEGVFDWAECEREEQNYWVELKRHDNDN